MNANPYTNRAWNATRLGLLIGAVLGFLALLADIAPATPLQDAPPVRERVEPQERGAVSVPTARAYQRALARIKALEARCAALEARLEALEAPAPEPTPDPRPDPRPDPGPDPRPDPPPTGDDLPAIEGPQSVAWNIVLADGARVRGSGVGEDGVFMGRAGPFSVAVLWDDFDGPRGSAMAPTPTLILANAYRGTGIVRWKAGTVSVGRWTVDLGADGAMMPRQAVVRTALGLEEWKLVGGDVPVPQELRARALSDVAASKAAHVGPYEFFAKWTDPSEPGGRSIAPYHGGARDWFNTPEGRLVRAAEAVGAMSRGLWALNEDGTPWQPGQVGARYWWDASAIQYALEWQAAHGGEGWGYSPLPHSSCAYEIPLAALRPADISHGARWYRAVAALAQYSRAFRYMLVDGCWAEIKRSYSMDRRVPGSSDPNGILYNPLWWILEQSNKGAWGNRREAHAIMVAAEAAPYMSDEDRALYLPAFAELLVELDDGRGVLDHGCGGDALNWSKASGVACPVAMHFQQALIHEAAEWLGSFEEGRAAADVALRIATWWGANPAPYFAFTGGAFGTARDAPNSLTVEPKKTAVVDYTWFTHPETVDFDAVLSSAVGRGLTENPLDSVPPAARPRSWRP